MTGSCHGPTRSLYGLSYHGAGIAERSGKGLMSTTQLPFNTPQIPPYRDHKALNSGTLGGVGKAMVFGSPHRHDQPTDFLLPSGG